MAQARSVKHPTFYGGDRCFRLHEAKQQRNHCSEHYSFCLLLPDHLSHQQNAGQVFMKKPWCKLIQITCLVITASIPNSYAQSHPSLPEYLVHLSTCSWLHDSLATKYANPYRELNTKIMDKLQRNGMDEDGLLDIIANSLDAITEIPKNTSESDADYVSRLYHQEFRCKSTITEASSLLND